MIVLKPIRTNGEHAAALRALDQLLATDPKPRTPSFDQLEALTILIEAFERTHADHRIDDKVDPVSAIEFHLERLGKTAKDLEQVLGCSRTRVWEILQRRRALTLTQIRALVEGLGISANRLIAEYPTTRVGGRKRAVTPARTVTPAKSKRAPRVKRAAGRRSESVRP